jgi:signal transduction histidine kinase
MSSSPAQQSTEPPGPVRIFLLDDNAIDREVCRRHLQRLGPAHYEFAEHHSIEGAIQFVGEWDPDCILLDYHLQGGTGLEFLQALAAIGGPKRYPVVMLTGTGSERIAVEVMKTGAQDYLSKETLNAELLQRTIEAAIYRARTERLLEEQRAEMERLYQEARRANERKDEFLANLSHELRTPLTPVLAAVSQTDFSTAATTDVVETFALIRRNIEVEARLIDDLLDSTRIASGKLEIQRRTIDLHEVLAHAAEATDPDRHAKGIRLVWQLAPEPKHLHADAGRIQQVFSNLLKNAVKFTPGGGTITITTRRSDGEVEIEVADTGVGLPDGAAEKIFDAFEQGNRGVTRKFGGLGLGLAISKALVAAHGGSIRAANAPDGAGAVFTVRLPFEENLQPEHPRAAAPGPAEQAAAGTTILLVEDHLDSAASLRRSLTRRGYRVLHAASVTEALALFRSEAIDCLVSDLGLPDASGVELMEQIAAIRTVPAIALSGYGMERDIERSLAAGFRQHLTKPLDIEQLLRALETLLAGAGPAV